MHPATALGLAAFATVWGIAVAVAAQPAGGSDEANTRKQSPPETESTKRDEARAHFRRGIEYSEAGNWESALEQFRQSLALYPSRAAWKNAALCLERLGRLDEALETLESLADQFPQFSPGERLGYQTKLDELSRAVGIVELRGAPSGSHVWIDGRDRGISPMRMPLRVIPGLHRLRITTERAAPIEEVFEAIAGAITILQVRSPNPALDLPQDHALPPPPVQPPPSLLTAGESSSRPAPSDPHPPGRFGLGAEPALLFSSLGGDVASCAGGCRRGLGWGGRLMIRLGYRMSERWRISLDAGYLLLSQTIEHRPATLVATGIASAGTVDDVLSMAGALFGISAQYRPPRLGPTLVRIGAGALVGGLRVERRGEFPSSGGGVGTATPSTYRIEAPSQRPPLEYLYVSLGFELGFRPSAGWWMGAGLDLLSLFAIREPTWHDEALFLTPLGESSFPRETLAGRLVLVWCPSLTARYDF